MCNLLKRFAIFWDFAQRRFAIPYRRFGTTNLFHLQGLRNLRIIPRMTAFLDALKMVSICYPETSVRNYHNTLLNVSEERRSHLHRGGRLKLRNLLVILCTFHYMSVSHCCARIWLIHFSNVCWHGVYMICEIFLMLEMPYWNFDCFVFLSFSVAIAKLFPGFEEHS
jgi:hypothetical protein